MPNPAGRARRPSHPLICSLARRPAPNPHRVRPHHPTAHPCIRASIQLRRTLAGYLPRPSPSPSPRRAPACRIMPQPHRATAPSLARLAVAPCISLASPSLACLGPRECHRLSIPMETSSSAHPTPSRVWMANPAMLRYAGPSSDASYRNCGPCFVPCILIYTQVCPLPLFMSYKQGL